MSAIKPTFFNIPSLKLTEEAEKKGASEEETALYAMSNSKGWAIFEELAKNVLADLDQINAEAIANGSSFEEIGKNTLVISLAKDIINRLLNKVYDARDTIEGDK